MAAWSTRRKVTYLSIVFAVVFVFIILPIFAVFYQKPTCYDGKKNGDETGVDCGGSCQVLCSFEALDPIVLWSRAFKVSTGIYSAVAYIENPNINSESFATYIFKLYDENNVLITSKENRTFIPKNKVFAVFEPNLETQSKVPVRVTFEFKEKPFWVKNLKPVPDLIVGNKTLSGIDTSPRLDAIIENKSINPVERVEAVAIIFDDKENAIAASRTFVDRLEKDGTAPITFTWPLPFQTKEEICRVPGNEIVGERPESLGVMLAIDRSGSMASDGKNPPQPLTDVKNAAISFVDELQGTDQVGVVSFATEASNPVDSVLSRNYPDVKTAINNIGIKQNGTQYTNLGDGIEKAASQLLAPIHNLLTNKIIILLTDGIATMPEKAGENDYPSIFAKEKAEAAKKNNVELYIIGLGSEVNREYLEGVASSPKHYFAAATSKELKDIYKEIAVRFCKTGPSVIEVILRIIPAR